MKTPRAIIRDDDILSGRWHFDGTTIPIGAMRLHRKAYVGPEHEYAYLDLTSDEISAGLAFDFPSIRELGLQMVYAGFTLLRECGEETHQAMSGFEQVEVEAVSASPRWLISRQQKWRMRFRPACRSPCSQVTSSYCSSHLRYGHRFVVVQRARALRCCHCPLRHNDVWSDARAKFVAVIVTRASQR